MNTVNFPHRSEPGTTVSSQVLSNDAPANASPFTPAAPSPATTTDKAGQGMVTLKDVANRAGVSLSTAGAALRGESIVKTTTKELILQAARELGYSTNLPARYLKKGRTGAIAVMIPHILQPYYARLAYAIDAEASRHGLRTIIQQTGYTSMSEESALHRINSMPCDGLILNMSNVDADHLHTMIGNHPTVLLNYHADPPLFDNVASPIASSATTAFGYLRGRGYRRVAIIGGQRIDRFEPDLQAQKTHTHYVMQALESTGLGSPGDFVYCSWSVDGGLDAARVLCTPAAESADRHGTEGAGDTGIPTGGPQPVGDTGRTVEAGTTPPLGERLVDRYDAFYCMNDLIAYGLIRGLRDAGIRVPDDKAVFGNDGIQNPDYMAPRLSTVAVDYDDMARKAVAMLIERINDPSLERAPRREVAECHLVIGESA